MNRWGPLQLGPTYAGRLPIASQFRTLEARTARFGLGGPVWWIDETLTTMGTSNGSAFVVGPLPGYNTTFFAPFDHPAQHAPLRLRRVVRVLLANSWDEAYYPGNPSLAEPDHEVASNLVGRIAPAVAAAVDGRDVLYCLHQALPERTGSGAPESRWLRALAPPTTDFYATDVLNLVFLFESGRTEWLLDLDGTSGGYFLLPWNYRLTGNSPYATGADGLLDDLTATYEADAAWLTAAYSRFPRYRTVLYDCGPWEEQVAGNATIEEVLTSTRELNAAQLEAIVARLGAYGVEYGGAIDPTTVPAGRFVDLVKAHFNLP